MEAEKKIEILRSKLNVEKLEIKPFLFSLKRNSFGLIINICFSYFYYYTYLYG